MVTDQERTLGVIADSLVKMPTRFSAAVKKANSTVGIRKRYHHVFAYICDVVAFGVLCTVHVAATQKEYDCVRKGAEKVNQNKSRGWTRDSVRMP